MQESDLALAELTGLAELQEVILDCPLLGRGWQQLLDCAGARLTKLALSLVLFTGDQVH